VSLRAFFNFFFVSRSFPPRTLDPTLRLYLVDAGTSGAVILSPAALYWVLPPSLYGNELIIILFRAERDSLPSPPIRH